MKEKLELKDVLRNDLEESRMVLPGIQALFGFQLIAVFNAGFKDLSSAEKSFHLLAVLLTITAIACLMAPASYHRQVERHSVSEEFIEIASRLVYLGMVPLLLSISLDTYIVARMTSQSVQIATGATTYAASILAAMWYLWPYLKKIAIANKKKSEPF